MGKLGLGADTVISKHALHQVSRRAGIEQAPREADDRGAAPTYIVDETKARLPTQICQASRPMTGDEKTKVKEQRKADVTEIPVALDAFAVYVNKKNPIEHLSMAQVARIFKAEVTNWKDVGGPNAPIILYGRENSSGTYVFFKEHVLANADFAEKYQALPGLWSTIEHHGGAGFTQWQSVNKKDMATEDLVQVASGSTAATQTFGAADRYLAQMVAFKHR